MLLLDTHLPINLEILDAEGNAISGIAAILCHMDGDWAVISLQPESQVPCLHWGARVRFWVGNGPQGYEVTGAVAGMDLRRSFEQEPDEEKIAGELRVRLFECRLRPQLRNSPRRRARFAVRLLPLPESADAPAAEKNAMDAACIDISCSGMRLRTEHSGAVPDRVALEFTLPAHPDSDGARQPERALRLQGCVLRREPSARRAQSIVIAVKFDILSVEDGLALSSFVY